MVLGTPSRETDLGPSASVVRSTGVGFGKELAPSQKLHSQTEHCCMCPAGEAEARIVSATALRTRCREANGGSRAWRRGPPPTPPPPGGRTPPTPPPQTALFGWNPPPPHNL